MAEKKNKTKSVNIKNKRASFDFLLLDKYTAGIVLTGTEIKSIRAGKASLVDTFCFIHNGEVWVKNMYVAEYSYGSYNNHGTARPEAFAQPQGNPEVAAGHEKSRLHIGADLVVYRRERTCQSGCVFVPG